MLSTLPLNVYIDNNILNDIAPKDAIWTDTEWGKELVRLTEENKIAVWASPANILEVALNPDLEHRNNMAIALNTLVQGKRVMPSYETIFIENFFEKLNVEWPGSISFIPLERTKKLSSQTYIALLGQLAALRDYDCSAGFYHVIKPKIITQIIHASIFEDPKNEIQKRIDQFRSPFMIQNDFFSEYDNKTVEELQVIEKEVRSKKFIVDKKAVELLKKNKTELIIGYANEDLYLSISQVFGYVEDLIESIHFKNIVLNWEKGSKAKPLLVEVAERIENGNYSRDDIYTVTTALMNRFGSLWMPQIYQRTIVGELEIALNNGKIPTGGLVLDGQHTVSATCCDLFVCRDTRLSNTVKSIFKEISSGTDMNKVVAEDLNDFKRKIDNLISK